MFSHRRIHVSALALAVALAGLPAVAQTTVGQVSAVANPSVWPATSSPSEITDVETEAEITALMARMTLEEKVGQLIQADIGTIKPEDFATYPLASIFAGGSSSPGDNERAPLAAWVELARSFRAAAAARPGAAIPLIFGIDAVHGHNNIVGATLFPHNIGLGAARDPDLIERIGAVTALEVAASGAEWTFGPTLAVPRNDRWGRTYEGYSENPEIVASYSGAMTRGLQGRLMAGQALSPENIGGSAKHFLADGGTEDGRDQGNAILSEADLVAIHARGYVPAIEAGVLTVMASFSSWNGVKLTGNRSILTDVLKGQMGFEGFVVGDWNAHGQVPGCSNESCPEAINAGLDMFMSPDGWRELYANTLEQARSGVIPAERIEDAVRRVLRVKYKIGVFDRDYSVENRTGVLGAPAHRELAREAVRKSMVLLKNEGVLPIQPGANVLVAGTAADSIGQAAGGWTISWQGADTTNADFPGGTSIWTGLERAITEAGGTASLSVNGTYEERPDVAIVVFGEMPYAEFQGDLENVDFLPEGPLALLRELQAAGIPTVSVFLSGRPLWMNPEINASDAFVAAWLPGTEGGGIADVLVASKAGTAAHDFSGRLSFSWPRNAAQDVLNIGDADYAPQFAYGFGLSYAQPGRTETLSENPGIDLSATSLDAYYSDGRVPAPWSLILRDEGGNTRVGTVPRATSPRATVSLQPANGAAQESAMAFSFTGPADAYIYGQAVDLTRQLNADLTLTFSIRADTPITSPIELMFGSKRLDLAPSLTDLASGTWRRLSVRLACFGTDSGAAAIETPFGIHAGGPLNISIEDVGLKPQDGPKTCPE